MDESEGAPYGCFLYLKVSYRNSEDGEVARGSTWLHVLMPILDMICNGHKIFYRLTINFTVFNDISELKQ